MRLDCVGLDARKQKPPFGGFDRAPPRGLEPRLSAPEADALSTELRGQAQEFYHDNE